MCAFWLIPAVIQAVGGCRREPRTTTPQAPREEAPWFEEMVDASHIGFVHMSGHRERFWYPEIFSGGVCLLDFDKDGFLDVYLIQGGDLGPVAAARSGNRLYRNNGDWTFEDVTGTAKVGDTGYGMGCTCGDYDGDGDTDIYVTNLGPNVLYRNNGDGTFTDVTNRAKVGDSSWSTSCAFFDYDEDGLLDLMVANYIHWSPRREMDCFSPRDDPDYCGPENYNTPARDTLYHNIGGGVFEDATVTAGLQKAFGNGLGVACADFDGDGLIDIYVANDGMPNQLWRNTGPGHFTDVALFAGCAVNRTGAVEAGMGIASIDIDVDGDQDLFMTHLGGQTNTLYLNQDGFFEDATGRVGLGVPSLPFTGFGLGFADFDHDGFLDLYVANGRVRIREPLDDPGHPYAEVNQVFRGLPNGRFEEVWPRGGTSDPIVATSRAAALGDLDNDGAVDLVVANMDGTPHLLRNIAGARGSWIMFRVLDRAGADALGAAVMIHQERRTQRRHVQVAYSYCAGNDPRVHFGLGNEARIDFVAVRWPNGDREQFGSFTSGRIYTLKEGDGRPKPSRNSRPTPSQSDAGRPED